MSWISVRFFLDWLFRFDACDQSRGAARLRRFAPQACRSASGSGGRLLGLIMPHPCSRLEVGHLLGLSLICRSLQWALCPKQRHHPYEGIWIVVSNFRGNFEIILKIVGKLFLHLPSYLTSPDPQALSDLFKSSQDNFDKVSSKSDWTEPISGRFFVLTCFGWDNYIGETTIWKLL